MTLDRGIFAAGLADVASSRRITAATAGAIWFMTTNVKALFNVERSVFDGGRAGAKPPERSALFRMQLNF